MELAIWVLVAVNVYWGGAIWFEQKESRKEVRRIRELMERDIPSDAEVLAGSRRYVEEVDEILRGR